MPTWWGRLADWATWFRVAVRPASATGKEVRQVAKKTAKKKKVKKAKPVEPW